jgi:hypothetical protein
MNAEINLRILNKNNENADRRLISPVASNYYKIIQTKMVITIFSVILQSYNLIVDNEIEISLSDDPAEFNTRKWHQTYHRWQRTPPTFDGQILKALRKIHHSVSHEPFSKVGRWTRFVVEFGCDVPIGWHFSEPFSTRYCRRCEARPIIWK